MCLNFHAMLCQEVTFQTVLKGFLILVCKRHTLKKKPHTLTAMVVFVIFAGAAQGVITFSVRCIWSHVFNLCCFHHVATN